MAQYNKLFDKSEIEYITPFLKLWMSFNNWYKQDLSEVKIKIFDDNGNIKKNPDGTDKEKNITADFEAINYYKTGGQVKTEFVKLLNSRSPNDEPFQNGLSSFVKLIQELNNSEFQFSPDIFYQNPAQRTIISNSLVYISPTQKEYYYSSGDEDRLYEETLSLIYKIRCSLVHGDFDIEDRIFIGLIECSYKIIYPIMDKLIHNNEIKIFYCQNKKGTNASGNLLSDGKMIVLKDSKICKEVTDSYSSFEERSHLLSENSTENSDYYVLTKNIEFSSPSAASSFCLGKSSNGWIDWKDKKEVTMSEIIRRSSN